MMERERYELMRILSLRLIVALIVGVTLVSLASSWYGVRAEKDALRRDLERKAGTLGESLAGNAELYLATADRAGLEQLVQRFSNRDHLLGIGVYGPDGSTLVVTRGLNSVISAPPQLLKDALTSNRTESRFMLLRFKRVYMLAAPLHSADKSVVVGGIIVVHEAAYIRTARVAQWMKALRTGRHVVQPSANDLDFLLPLTREVAPLAHSMQQARAAAEMEARLRNTNESLWTAQRLAEHVRGKLDGSSLFVVSNREPYIHNRRGNTVTTDITTVSPMRVSGPSATSHMPARRFALRTGSTTTP